MFTGLDLLFLEVNSLEESLAFYVGQLDFALESHAPESEPPLATLRAGRLKVTLAEVPVTLVKRGRGAHFFIGVTDVDEYYRKLRAKDLFLALPADEGWGGRFITLQDGDNYRIFFVEWDDKSEGEA